MMTIAFYLHLASRNYLQKLFRVLIAARKLLPRRGQPDWRQRLPNGRLPAPPHDATGHTWHHSDEQIFRIVKDGLPALPPGYQSGMQAYGGVLDDAQIKAILDLLRAPGRSATSSKAGDGATQ